MLHILRLVTCDDTASAATDREMVTEKEEYSDDDENGLDDLSMLGPDAGRWWNYSEKVAGDDYSLENIKENIRSDESVLEDDRNLFIEKLT